MSTRQEFIQSIYDEHGYLSPELVVDVIRPVEHPEHHRVNWDDASAGEAWRHEQAAAIIRSVSIRYVDNSGAPQDLRAFVAVKGEGTPRASYVPTAVAMADPFMKRLILRDMERDWIAFQRRYGHMVEFTAMILGALEGVVPEDGVGS